jgi:hypothetical protein
MTLSNEDKALIKETSDLLKQLKPLLNKVEKFICKPIDTTEGEQEQGKEWKSGDYVMANITIPKHITKDRYYPAIEETEYHYKVFTDELGYQNIHKAHFIQAQEQAPIETEQRWQPSYGQQYFVVDLSNEVLINWYDCENDDIDKLFIKNNNCFKTKEAAQKAAEAIKQYLSTNKF